MGQSRSVVKKIAATSLLEGGGFPVRRPFPTGQVREVDPFLLLDHMGPVDWPPNEAIGAPDHPHRGFETVTYLLSGKMAHRDSFGHKGLLGPGDVQWMTAGSGLVHSELPEAQFKKQGGVLEGFQLWINLPASHKMISPAYQEIPSDQIPEVLFPGGVVRVISGQIGDCEGVIHSVTPVTYLHIKLDQNAQMDLTLPAAYPMYGYISAGFGSIGKDQWSGVAGDFFFLGPGDSLELTSKDEPLSVLILGAAPINEPIVRQGPFVMNSQAEITEAFEDFHAGKMGKI